jgi:hypothetical protein
MKHDINALRAALFDTLAGLRDKEDPLDIDRARAIVSVAGAITDTAKVEVDFARAAGREVESQFIGGAPALPAVGAIERQPTKHGEKTIERIAGATITTHRMT